MHKEEPRWLKAPQQKNIKIPFLKGIPIKALDNEKVEYEAETEKGKIRLVANLKDTYEMSKGELHADMCEMNILNEPEILRNLTERYKKDDIFTYIGPTLIVVNPYKIIERHFNNRVLTEIKDAVLAGNLKGAPHIYLVAGRAYQGLVCGQGKQAVVISGESGAGKTESTKYCMKIITSLNQKQNHSIEKKILACNPLLQAFGNSKTVRNDNSSRFGKYMQIYFGNDNTIRGANIISYLLEKSRVVSVAQNERTFHAFYTLTASGKYGAKEASKYAFLHQSGTYVAANIDDAKYFIEINKSMEEIGFTEAEQSKIWELVWSVLELGNLEFKDTKHLANQADPCEISGNCDLKRVSKLLKIDESELKKLILFEKRVFKKEQAFFKAYSKNGCIANRNTLCKAIYNSIFQFIIYKIQIALNPHTNETLNSINLLDIFGFENFGDNSLEQLCINFTNEKLLKQYNRYVFENQMIILREDGLQKEIKDINPPTNDNVISLLSGKLSLFSIINDNTPNIQFKDEDMIAGFARDYGKNPLLRFDLIKKNNFTIVHSQCEVTYNIEGFKLKNQDKVSPEIEEIYTKLFVNQNKNQVGKTLLKKFQKEIDDLVTELSTATNHFVRCIKPNEQKMPNRVDPSYMLTQVRYLGVFETIQIRQKTFPARKTYSDFITTFQPIFKNVKGKTDKDTIIKILSQVKAKEKDFLLGIKRIYMNKQLEDKLNKEVYKFFRIKNEKATKIQKMFRKFKMRKLLTKLAKKNKILKKIYAKSIIRQIAKRYCLKFQEVLKKQEQLRLEKLRQKERLEEEKAKQELELSQKMRIAKENKKQLKIESQAKKVVEEPIVDSTNISLKGMLGDESSFGDMSIIVDTPQKNYKRLQRPMEKEESQGNFNVSFTGEKSIYLSDNPDAVFQHTLQLMFYQGQGGNFQKLQKILSQQYKLEVTGNEEEFFSPNSQDCNFLIEDTPPQLLNKIIHFNADDFFKRVLRKRTTFIGLSKDYKDVLVAKNRPLNKTLTLMTDFDEDKALKVFKVIVRIGQQAKLDNVFRLIENMISLCQSTTQQLKNEVFLQLVKQSYTSHELAAVRIYQSLAVFLHIYIPDQDFLMAVLFLFNKKLHQGKSSEKEEDYLRYLFKKMIRKIENPPAIGYMPIKYQMMALMCKRQISIPVYLPIGNSILIRVESYDTFADIKERVITEFGINHQRIRPEMFRFFEIVNFENEELEQAPINESQIVWDIMTYWQLAKDKYKEANSPPPAFFLMLKIVYCFEVTPQDNQGIQLCFAQCYFDYFIGRIRLDFDHMAALAACVKKIKLPNRPQHEILGSYPIWMAKKYDKKELIDAMIENLRQMQKEGLDLMQMKYRFLQICDKCPLAMAMAIPTEQPVKLYFKPKKIYLTEKSQIRDEFSMRNIIKWAIDKEKFVFDVKGNTSHVVFTEFAYICSQFLSDLPKILKKKA